MRRFPRVHDPRIDFGIDVVGTFIPTGPGQDTGPLRGTDAGSSSFRTAPLMSADRGANGFNGRENGSATDSISRRG